MSATLLIAEDDPALRSRYSKELKREGYQFLTGSDGPATLKKVKESNPDLVLLDIRMPGMDGIEVMGRILEDRPKLPVIINTAYSSCRDSFLSWSADAYVLKSSDLSELKETSRSVLERRRSGAESQAVLSS